MRGREVDAAARLLLADGVSNRRCRSGVRDEHRRDIVLRQQTSRLVDKHLAQEARVAAHQHAMTARLAGDIAGDAGNGAAHIRQRKLIRNDGSPARGSELDLRGHISPVFLLTRYAPALRRRALRSIAFAWDAARRGLYGRAPVSRTVSRTTFCCRTQSMTGARLILVTTPQRAEAKRIAHALVEERLAACVNLIGGVHSVYRWNEAVETADEVLLLIKTREETVDAVRTRVHQLHSYELPEFLVLDVAGGSENYLAWIGSSVG